MELSYEQKWWWIDMAVKAFIAQYPKACSDFMTEINYSRSKYGLSDDKEMRKANQRCTLSFPTVRNKNGDDDCLLPIIERYFPNFRKKNSKEYVEFIRRYPAFSMAEKL